MLRTALILTALAAILWSLEPHSSSPMGPYLVRVMLTGGGPISLWVIHDFPLLDLSTLAFVVIIGMVQTGVILSNHSLARLLGLLGILSWFLMGAGSAGLATT